MQWRVIYVRLFNILVAWMISVDGEGKEIYLRLRVKVLQMAIFNN